MSKHLVQCFTCLLSLLKTGREINLCFIWFSLYFHVLCYWKCMYVFNTLCNKDFFEFFWYKVSSFDLRRQTLCLANEKLGKIFQTVNFCLLLIRLPKAICLVASGLSKLRNMVNNLKKLLENVLAYNQLREASVGLSLTRDFCASGMWKYVRLGQHCYLISFEKSGAQKMLQNVFVLGVLLGTFQKRCAKSKQIIGKYYMNIVFRETAIVSVLTSSS